MLLLASLSLSLSLSLSIFIFHSPYILIDPKLEHAQLEFAFEQHLCEQIGQFPYAWSQKTNAKLSEKCQSPKNFTCSLQDHNETRLGPK